MMTYLMLIQQMFYNLMSYGHGSHCVVGHVKWLLMSVASVTMKHVQICVAVFQQPISA